MAGAIPLAKESKRQVPKTSEIIRHETGGVGTHPLSSIQSICPCGGGCPRCSGMVQAKLMKVGPPGDEYEQEADRIADQVMSMPEPGLQRQEKVRITPLAKTITPIVQRKEETPDAEEELDIPLQRSCGSCGEEEEKPLQRKESGMEAGAISPGLQNHIDSLRGGGRPLDAASRAFFEPRFGADFSHVQIHDHAGAADSARSLNARAYTAGNDIAFGAGEYDPGEFASRRLLAHELVHVLQQNKVPTGVIRRASVKSFRVDELFKDRLKPEYARDVFFDFDQPKKTPENPEADPSVIDPGEAKKPELEAIHMKAAGIPSLTLIGYASEEGDPSYNWHLANRRVKVVKKIMNHQGITDAQITPKVDMVKSRKQIDYRFWRVVEMIPTGEGSRRKSAAASKAVLCKTADPTGTKMPKIRSAIKNAKDMLKESSAKYLAPYISGALDVKTRDKVKNALFHEIGGQDPLSYSNDTATKVKQKMDGMHAFLDQKDFEDAKLFCGDKQTPGCCASGSTACAGVDLTICPPFFNDTPDWNTMVVTHESAHGCLGCHTHDRSYNWERAILVLDRDQALDNADSLTNFVYQVCKGALLRSKGPPKADVIDPNCDLANTGKDKGKCKSEIDRAVAWAQRLTTWAYQGIAQTYGNIANSNYMNPDFQKCFKVSAHNRRAVAGIYDRFRKMNDWFRPPKVVRINCPGDLPPCNTGNSCFWEMTAPNPKLALCRSFFVPGMDQPKQTNEVLGNMALKMKYVELDQKESYPCLAYQYKTKFWGVSG